MTDFNTTGSNVRTRTETVTAYKPKPNVNMFGIIVRQSLTLLGVALVISIFLVWKFPLLPNWLIFLPLILVVAPYVWQQCVDLGLQKMHNQSQKNDYAIHLQLQQIRKAELDRNMDGTIDKREYRAEWERQLIDFTLRVVALKVKQDRRTWKKHYGVSFELWQQFRTTLTDAGVLEMYTSGLGRRTRLTIDGLTGDAALEMLENNGVFREVDYKKFKVGIRGPSGKDGGNATSSIDARYVPVPMDTKLDDSFSEMVG